MNYITLIIFFVVILICLIFICQQFSLNYIRHLDKNQTVAHFSKIDRKNYLFFPTLLLTHPQYYHLKAGDALYIPPKWWHWIENIGANVAVNFWGENSGELIYGDKPFTTKHQQYLSLQNVMNDVVSVWDSSQYNIKTYDQRLKDFLNQKSKGHYVITLDKYATGQKNAFFREKLGVQLTPVDGLPEYHIWISANSVDSGLHFDDTPGLLCVIKGEKKITLYPPSDTKYLHPI